MDLPRRAAPPELLTYGRKLRITCAVLSRLGRQGSLPFRTFAGLLFTAGLRRSRTLAMSLAVALRRVLKASSSSSM